MAVVILNSVSQAAQGSPGKFVEEFRELQVGHPKVQAILQKNQIEFAGPRIIKGKPGTTSMDVNSSDFPFALDALQNEGITFD